MVDKIINGKTRTHRQFCSFYTESDPILTYMVNKLGVTENDVILEPCAGDGVFIEKIISTKGNGYKIDALDLNPTAVEGLKNKFQSGHIAIRQADTLLDPTLDLFANSNGYYTKIIGNPPYGAWQDYKKRDVLKKIYGGYVKETYTLFIKKCIDLLKKNGRLVFIIPDTFLALHLHKDTREKILKETKVEEILLIPSNFFPGVNFGYSNLCIITLEKNKDNQNNKTKIFFILDKVDNLYELAKGNFAAAGLFEEIEQEKIKNSVDSAFLLGGNTKIRKLINDADIKLGNIANCVTGFYSGDNKHFLAVKNHEVRGAKEYQVIDDDLIEFDFLKQEKLIDGLTNKKQYIPVLKGGNGRFIKSTEWFVKWSKQTVNFYHQDKKTRFQNSQYYFREGIGAPMVKSTHLHAFLLEKRLFDQSIVGIFPKDGKHLNYLLAFLNSDVCSKIMRVINHTANNSANYLKKLPIIENENALKEINVIMKEYFTDKNEQKTLDKINIIFNELYKL